MKRKHRMPFGAEYRGDGTASFRLWAPRASSLALRLGEKELPMRRAEEGWFEILTEAQAGSRYHFRIDGQHHVPDPASRFQPRGVHGDSELVDPDAFTWEDENWQGRSWNEAVVYELHVGSFSPEGTYAGLENRLDHLSELGVSAIELMPLASFPGERNWGYDGVLPYAPACCYGRPADLKHLVQTAHKKNLMVFLDVVYNHFGPEGNYLHLYAPQFFSDRYRTPWGQAINFDGPGCRTVRDYYIHNALYWLEEYHFDGLRLDAVHAIRDSSKPDILTELAQGVHQRFTGKREIHLILENDNNASRYLGARHEHKPALYTAQWNDDIHHALHVLIAGERDGYYVDYAPDPTRHLGRCLAEGFSFQGESSPLRQGRPRGEPSRELPPTCFVSFLQNHDQIGNRALGERIVRLADPRAIRTALTILLLAPAPPLIFMGEEFGATTPFLFFCDFGAELAGKVTEGRRAEFARFEQFRSPAGAARIPDPNDIDTFLASKLDWNSLPDEPHCRWLDFYKELLRCRREAINPQLADIVPGQSEYEPLAAGAVRVRWALSHGRKLELLANVSAVSVPLSEKPQGHLLYREPAEEAGLSELPPFSAAWFLNS
ncbi:MAG: malto-oligosyltrehalose trehalohydrolase [Acidobacteria bacterium]|nr:malto-oligosyltrehalose trehalohydrolase [Acidobacteriota bacterium]